MSEFSGKLGTYRVIETEDGSPTLFSEAFNEACHSNQGAILETTYIYIEGCQLEKKREECPVIFETGFGAGIGLKTTLEYMEGLPFTFISTEIDPSLIEHCGESLLPKLKSFEKIVYGNYFYLRGKIANAEVLIFIGDATDTIPKAIEMNLIPELDFIYQDAFSPGRNPDLWTVEWFETLFGISKTEVIMSTYSASTSVRKSMMQAGFFIHNRKGFGAKRTCTWACRNTPTENELITRLDQSGATPLFVKDIS